MPLLARLTAFAVAALWLALAPPAPALAQGAPAAATENGAAETLPDPFGRTTPAGTVAGYIQALTARDYERAARYLELSPQRRARRGAELAQRFQAVLDREGAIRPRTELSRDPAGALDDYLDPELERVGSLRRGTEDIPLLLRRTESSEDAQVWLFSRETLSAALALDVAAPDVPAERWLPAAASGWNLGGAPVSHWVSLVAVTIAAFAAAWATVRLLLLLLGLGGARAAGSRRFLATTALPLILFAAVGLASWTAPLLGVSIVAREAFSWLTLIAGWIALGWLLWRAVDLVSARMLAGFHRRGRASATAIIRVAGRAAKLAIIAVTLIAVFDVFGFEVTAALAALGIGGIALALGAQKTVENLFASLSIISDRPFKVGDVCRFGDKVGTVEDVGMRSSRVRTLERTLLTIPNSTLVNSEIENLSARDRFLYQPVLHLAAEIAPDRLRTLLVRIENLFKGDERLLDGRVRVRLLQPVEDRLPIELFGYILTDEFDIYLAVQQDLTLRLLDLLTEEKVELAPPAFDLGKGGRRR
jgi:MscS family membrane protein